MARPLEGYLVVDMTRVLAGPYCTMLLADLGARVIKVEIPQKGDDSRGYGPFVNEESGYFMSVNRNKESLTLDLKSEAGKEIFKKLVRKADILVENFRYGTMEKLGFSYQALRELNPKLIYTTITGFGHSGPYRDRPAYDIIIQGIGGMMSITGEEGGSPTKVGASIADINAGIFAALGTLGAVIEMQRSGEGQHVDISMLDALVAILENAITRYTVTGEVPKSIGNRHPSITPFCALPCSDGYINVAIGSQSLWNDFCKTIGREDLIDDPRFQTNALRTQNWKQLEPILVEVFKTKSRDQWLNLLEEKKIPCGPINFIDQVVLDPQIQSRNMVIELDHPKAGKVKVAGNPIKYSRTTCDDGVSPSPLLGEHTENILLELGYGEEEINYFKSIGVI